MLKTSQTKHKKKTTEILRVLFVLAKNPPIGFHKNQGHQAITSRSSGHPSPGN